MQKLVWIPVLMLLSLSLLAQQDPQFTQTGSMRLSANPAVAGHRNLLCGQLVVRQQWAGLESAPSTEYFSVNAPVIDLHGGLGLQVFRDRVGPEKTLSIQAAYAYRLRFARGMLSGGISLGWMQKRLESKWNLPADQIAIDNLIPEAGVASSAFDLGLGVYYEDRSFYAGLSTNHPHAPRLELDLTGKTWAYQIARHYYAMAGYRHQLRDFELRPNLWLRSDGTELQVQTGMEVIWNGQVGVGMAYRHRDAISPSMSYRFPMGNRMLKVGYAYDLTLSNLNATSSGSHEFLLGICQPMFKKPPTKWRNPRNLSPRNYM